MERAVQPESGGTGVQQTDPSVHSRPQPRQLLPSVRGSEGSGFRISTGGFQVINLFRNEWRRIKSRWSRSRQQSTSRLQQTSRSVCGKGIIHMQKSWTQSYRWSTRCASPFFQNENKKFSRTILKLNKEKNFVTVFWSVKVISKLISTVAPEVSPKRGVRSNNSQGSPLWLKRGPKKFVKGGSIAFFLRGPNLEGGQGPLVPMVQAPLDFEFNRRDILMRMCFAQPVKFESLFALHIRIIWFRNPFFVSFIRSVRTLYELTRE